VGFIAVAYGLVAGACRDVERPAGQSRDGGDARQQTRQRQVTHREAGETSTRHEDDRAQHRPHREVSGGDDRGQRRDAHRAGA
jgi:hypothetical protein